MSEPDAQTDDLHIIREVHLNYSQDQPVRAPLTDSDAAAGFLRGVVSDTTREHAVAIYLDAKNRPLGWRTVSIGTDVSAPVKPLLVLQPAVLLGANAMIFAHNHPSGDLEPSPEDKKLAEMLCQACTLLGHCQAGRDRHVVASATHHGREVTASCTMPMGRCVCIGSRARDSDVLEALDALHAGVGASIDGRDVDGACRSVRLIRLREQIALLLFNRSTVDPTPLT